MSIIIKKHLPLVSFLLLVVLFAALLFWPAVANALTAAMLVLGISMTAFFVVRRQAQAYHENKIDRAALARNILVEVAGILIAMALATFFIRQVAKMVISFTSGAAGILFVIVVSVLIGLGAGMLVKMTWGRLTKA